MYSNATLDQEFDASTVLVVMDKNVSRINRVFDTSFFGADLAIAGIEDLSIVVNEEMLAAKDYRAVPSANSWAADYVAAKDSKGAVECQCDSCTSESRAAEKLPDNWKIDRANFRQILQITLPTDSKEDVLKTIAKLEQIDGIMSVEPNHIIANCCDKTPNDPKYKDGTQWAPNKISAPTAWDTTTGSSNIKVGVLDSGVDVHLDLMANVCRLSAYDFVANTPILSSDPLGHGTHVAGIIGAGSNNLIGVTGVAWSVTLVPIRVITADNTSTEAWIANGINHATNNGIHILNASLRWPNSTVQRQAISNYPGLFVASAGNSNINNDVTPQYPASYGLSNIISVGASTSSDSRASWSNYGKTTVHLFAPGENIYSTVPISGTSTIIHSSGFNYASGTSMAAPQVAGVAALMLSKNPNLTPTQIRTYIVNNVDKLTAFSSNCISGGRLNAQKALAAVPAPSSGC